jgi:hypothetical protein
MPLLRYAFIPTPRLIRLQIRELKYRNKWKSQAIQLITFHINIKRTANMILLRLHIIHKMKQSAELYCSIINICRYQKTVKTKHRRRLNNKKCRQHICTA